MRTFATLIVTAAVIFMAAGCASTARKAGGFMDTPQAHYKEGMKYFNDGKIDKAAEEFNLSASLDAKYAPAYAGRAFIAALKSDFKEANKLADKAQSLDEMCIDGYLAKAVVIFGENMGKPANEWLSDVEKQYKKAIKIDPQNSEIFFRRGMIYKSAFLFGKAADDFKTVLDLKKEWTKEADDQWQIVQMIERAAPGTDVGKKIALVDKISRADIAALFVSELNVDKLLQKKAAKTYDTGFKAPQDPREMKTSTVTPTAAVTDMKGHWAENFVNDVLALQMRGLEPYPDHTFKPDQLITRSEYAFMVEDILIAILGDQSLATKYVGSSPSRFPDVNVSSPYYNAICNMVDKGIMKSELNGEFGIEHAVSGAEALLVIRQLKELKK
ncbi:MAG: S-layer homology domain-containing protein [Chitinispirillaceae bacterium]|jgi:tetratricopeptide (TPR) repeat protein